MTSWMILESVTDSLTDSRHTYSFKHEKEKNATALSQHIWEIGENITPENPVPAIKWEVIKTTKPREPGSKLCPLCIEEKIQILKANKDENCLNIRSELSNRCIIYHRSKHKLLSVR